MTARKLSAARRADLRGLLSAATPANHDGCLVGLPDSDWRLMVAAASSLADALSDLDAADAELRAFGAKVNAIRESIIGAQTVNWSEHVYPLVAALDAAGFTGTPYPEARENFGTLIERAAKAEAEVARLTAELGEWRHMAGSSEAR